MPRFFIEVAYRGTNYSGFQIQQNSNTIQAEVEKAFKTIFSYSPPVRLTGSSRTDAGVHALQNYFHFDFEDELNQKTLYQLNAVLPADIVVKNIHPMHAHAHCRFDAINRAYQYRICREKNPFHKGLTLYYPYKLNLDLLSQAALIVQSQTNFSSYTKTKTQVSNFNCSISKSLWTYKGDLLLYNVVANRFLRGMVRLITAAMLQVARGKISIVQFQTSFQKGSAPIKYSAPAEGLFLQAVTYPKRYFEVFRKS
jgi:tRNA pseudouridine38-40 synthase